MMTDGFSMAEEFTIPSLGKVYDVKVNPIIKLKSMTTEHELRRLSPSERPYKTICEIIDDCMVENPGISSYDMCLADYMFLLYKLRTVTYGPIYPTENKCPFCASTNEVQINLDDLEVTMYDQNNFTELTQFTLPRTQKNIKISMQTPRMLDDVNVRNKETQRRTKGKSGDSAFLYTLEDVIVTIDNKKPDIITVDDFVRQLPMMDANYIAQHVQKLAESFGIKNTIDNTCPVCGLDYTSSFRIGQEFFRPRIDI